MNGHYDPDADALAITFSNAPIVNTEEVAEGFMIDLDADGNVVAVEMLFVSQRVQDPRHVDWKVFKLPTERIPDTAA